MSCEPSTATDSPYWPPPLLPPAARARFSPWRLVIWIVLGAFAGVGLGIALGVARRHVELDALDLYLAGIPPVHDGLVFAFIALMAWPQVLLHEAGHALGGLARGMQPIAFGVGAWRWERSGERWRLRRGGRVRGISGFAILLPRGERGTSRLDQAVYLLGGPLANLASLVVALALLPLATTAPVLAALLIGSACISAFVGVINLVPFESHGWRSDGRNLLALLMRSRDAEQGRRMRDVLGLTMAGVRPRDWPAQALPLMPAADDGTPGLADLSAIGLRLSHTIDSNDAMTAHACARFLAPGHARVPEALRPHLAFGMASFAALVVRDHALLAAWRPLCEGGLLDLTALRAWLDAELAALSGDAAGARTALAAARAVQTRVSDEASGVQLGEYLDALALRIDAMSADAL